MSILCTEAEHERLTARAAALIDVLANLTAAVSLLERGGRRGAASDKIFEQMLKDYRASIERGRSALREA